MLFYCSSTPGNPNIMQTVLVSLPLTVRFPPLFLAPPTPPPPFPSSWPHTSHTLFESPQLSTHSVVPLSTQKTIGSGVWPGESVCHRASLCPESASLSTPGVTTHESWESANHVGPDVPPQPPHSSPADCRCLCLAAFQKASLHALQT